MLRRSPALRRVLAIFLVFWLVGPVLAARADDQAAASPPAGSADTQQLIATLQNDQQREQLVKQLQALVAAQRGTAGVETNPATLLDVGRDKLRQLGADIVTAASVLVDLPSVTRWIGGQFADPASRARWADIGKNVGLIVGAAILGDFLVVFGLTGVRRRLRDPARRSSLMVRLLLELLVDGLPAIAFALVGTAAIEYVGPRFATRSVVSQLIAVVLLGRILLMIARAALLTPRRNAWGLLSLTEETANYLYIWARRFVIWGLYIFGIIDATWWLGLPGAVFVTLQKLVALVVTVLAVVFILQNRQAVANWIRPKSPPAAGAGAEDGAEAVFEPPAETPLRYPLIHLARLRLAGLWHVLAVAYIVGLFCVYALRIEGGFSFLFRATLLTITLMASARLLVYGVARLARRGFAIPDDLKARFPTLEYRANRYLTLLTGLASVLIWSFAALAVLELWGVGSFAWFSSETGRKVAGSSVTITGILATAFLVWELVNAAIDRYLARVEADGTPRAHAARVRTLLPLIRNALWFTLLIMTALLVLSELNINIVPLLAGASVVGLAVGIGSQALVKDIITGLFILIEDTIAIGDVVDFGNQHSGVVEAISVRTVRLRDQLGAVHTVPFSEISTVKNLTREYAYWLIEIGVAYTADPDQVMAAYRIVVDELRQDPAFGPLIVGEIDPIGVAALGPAAMQIQARIKTLPLQQWKVGREFNRRIKQAFEAAKIPLPSSTPTIALGQDLSSLVERLVATPSAPLAPVPTPDPGNPIPAPQSAG